MVLFLSLHCRFFIEDWLGHAVEHAEEFPFKLVINPGNFVIMRTASGSIHEAACNGLGCRGFVFALNGVLLGPSHQIDSVPVLHVQPSEAFQVVTLVRVLLSVRKLYKVLLHEVFRRQLLLLLLVHFIAPKKRFCLQLVLDLFLLL